MSFNCKECLFDLDHNDVPLWITYSMALDTDLLNVLEMAAGSGDKYYSDIARKLELDGKYVELLQHVLCTLDLCDYGTSPRGCWATETGLKYLEHRKKFN